MTKGLFDGLALTDWARNIVSFRQSQNIFDDLSDDPGDQAEARTAEMAAKPPEYGVQPITIQRPFREARWFEAIGFPFEHWNTSRFLAGQFGVWYGAYTSVATVYETVYHWRSGLLADAEGFLEPGVSMERKVYWVRSNAALVDLQPAIGDYPVLVASDDYSFTQKIGSRFHHDGYPGLVTRSARCADDVVAVFTPHVLSEPQPACIGSLPMTCGLSAVLGSPGLLFHNLCRPDAGLVETSEIQPRIAHSQIICLSKAMLWESLAHF